MSGLFLSLLLSLFVFAPSTNEGSKARVMSETRWANPANIARVHSRAVEEL
jgi:hypothetical protein